MPTVEDSMQELLADQRCLITLSRLLFSPEECHRLSVDKGSIESYSARDSFGVVTLSGDDLQRLLSLAQDHHVVVRALLIFRDAITTQNSNLAYWAANAIEKEGVRTENALSYLNLICSILHRYGCEVSVIKSLDHLPDFGNDLDLYTDAKPADVIRIMVENFNAKLEPRSWGDRLSGKWNFRVPGLPELVEIHVGRLGQTGEQVSIAASLMRRSYLRDVKGYRFRVPTSEDRLVICTLQRMYRHFYLRLCDIADTANALSGEEIDFPTLNVSAQKAGIWRGVATFLAIVSDYVSRYRGSDFDLPHLVTSTARFGGSDLSFHRFLRIPIVPHSFGLYAAEVLELLRNGELRSLLRLGLLPGLATAAALGQQISGSDKGIW